MIRNIPSPLPRYAVQALAEGNDWQTVGFSLSMPSLKEGSRVIDLETATVIKPTRAPRPSWARWYPKSGGPG